MAHGVPIEHKGREYEVHAIHIPGFSFDTLEKYIVMRKLRRKRDCIIAVTAWDRGFGKSILDQLIARRLWAKMHKAGLVNRKEWDWEYWTVFYDIDEYHQKYLEETGQWEILVDDESFEGMFSREAMHGGTKRQMKGFGTGRFLRKVAIISGPNLLWFDTLLRNFYVHVWLHVYRMDDDFAYIKIRVRCPTFNEPAKTAYWDCLAHIHYPLNAPTSLMFEYEREKKRAWREYQSARAD